MDPVVYAMYLYFLITQDEEIKENDHIRHLRATAIILNISKDPWYKERILDMFGNLDKVKGVIDGSDD